MSFNLIRIWHEMGPFARGIAVALAAMAVASFAVFVERLWGFWRARRLSAHFGEIAASLIDHQEYERLLDRAEQFRASPLAVMIAHGIRTYLQALRRPGNAVSPVELVRRDLARRAESQANEVRRGMNILASVGSVAPFIGLLGTVVGIITAFQGIAKEGSGGLGAVSAGIAEALVVTAFGLLVAIPAVLAFNYLSARADVITTALEQSRGEFIDMLETGHAAPPPSRNDERRTRTAARGAEVVA